MKIRVLRIINRLVIGGPAYNVSYLTKYLEPEFETILLSGPKEESEVDSDFIPRQMGIEPMYIKDMQKSLTKPWKDVKAYKEIKKVIEDFKPHIVHTHASKSGFLGRLVALDCKVPIILHTFHGHYFHSYFHPIKTKTLLTIERILSSKTEGIIAISPEQFKDLSEVYKVDKPSKIYEIPLGFDLDRFTIHQDEKRKEFRKEFGLKDDDVAIAIIGRMVPIKKSFSF
jgi:glycosyltransferase involved in cell wall biosynthesis